MKKISNMLKEVIRYKRAYGLLALMKSFSQIKMIAKLESRVSGNLINICDNIIDDVMGSSDDAISKLKLFVYLVPKLPNLRINVFLDGINDNTLSKNSCTVLFAIRLANKFMADIRFITMINFAEKSIFEKFIEREHLSITGEVSFLFANMDLKKEIDIASNDYFIADSEPLMNLISSSIDLKKIIYLFNGFPDIDKIIEIETNATV